VKNTTAMGCNARKTNKQQTDYIQYAQAQSEGLSEQRVEEPTRYVREAVTEAWENLQEETTS
jgi:hypothetical protein